VWARGAPQRGGGGVAQWLVWEVVGGTPRCPTAICIAAAAARFVCTDLSVGRQYHVCDGAILLFCSQEFVPARSFDNASNMMQLMMGIGRLCRPEHMQHTLPDMLWSDI